MSRLNLTLDDDTSAALARHAKKARRPRATLARELIREALQSRETLDARRHLASDYAAGRADSRLLLADLEAPQLELIEEHD